MNRIFQYVAFLAFLIVCPAVVLAADHEVAIRQLTTVDGLPCNSIRCVHQDNKGFIWLGTINSGLCRYDGRDFKTIYPEYGDEPGLPDPRINSIHEDNSGFLWVVTMSDRICCYDLKKERFVDFTGVGEYERSYGSIMFDDGVIWLWGRSQGCMRVRYSENIFMSEKFTEEDGTLPSDRVYFVFVHDGQTWIGTGGGLCRYSGGKAETIKTGYSFRFADVIDGCPHFISDDGQIWTVSGDELQKKAAIQGVLSMKPVITGCCSANGGWNIYTSSSSWHYDPFSGKAERLTGNMDLKAAHTKSDGKGNVLVYDAHGNAVYYDKVNNSADPIDLSPSDSDIYWTARYDFVRTDDGEVWISTHDNGLYVFDVKTKHTQHLLEDKGIASGILMCITEDRSGNFWLGTEFSGLFHLSTLNAGASFIHMDENAGVEYSNMVRMIDVRQHDGIWLCTRDGKIHMFSHDMSGKIRTVRRDASVYDVCRDTLLRQWVGTRGKGLYVGNENYSHRHDAPESLSSNNVFSIVRDTKGRMWVATFGGGLNLAETGRDGKLVFRSFFNDSYSRRRMRSTLCDSNGMLWVGTSGGLLVFDPDSLRKDADAYWSYACADGRLRSDEVRAIMEDSKGNVWVAESGAGFSICRPEKYEALEFNHYGTDDGLVNALVQGFVEDRYGKVWITTEYGVSCFDPQTEEFRNFIFSSNMQSNICLDNSVAMLEDGRLMFGTNSGVALIDPQVVLSRDLEETHVVFTDIMTGGISVSPSDDDAPMDASVAYQPDIRLKYSQNSFSVSFSDLDYATGTRYSYRLDGYDSEWSTPSELPYAAFRNVPPGHYTLMVRSCDQRGHWNEPSVLDITVRPPYYRTALAYIIYILLIGLLIYIALKIFRRMNDLRNEAKVEKQLTEYKLVFFTNISHEFRTPLTLILHSLEKLRAQTSHLPETARTVKVMETGAQRLLRLVNQLLEFRKLQNNKHRLRLEKTEVIGFFREIYDTFADAAATKNLDFSFNSSILSHQAYIDRGDMDKVVYNLLSNAIKYTPAGGKICFDVSVSDSDLVLKVTDTGIGIPEDKRKILFSRFMQSTYSESSMGVGLNLTRALVEAGKGKISFEPNPEGGSVFTVIMPLDLSLFDQEDIVTEETPHDYIMEIPSSPVEVDAMSEERPPKPLNPHKVLVIEDDPDIRKLIVDELSGYFNVLEAPDGGNGLDCIAREKDVEMILCDVLMPGISGYEVTDRIKSNFETCHIPVILLTALTSEEKQLEGFKSGADAYITKPFRPNFVLVRMLKLLEQRNRLREKFSNDLSLKTDSVCTNDRDREFMDKVDRILEVQLANPDFSMDDFASEMAMGRSSFYTKIQALTGYSPNRYIRILRMKKAAELLMKGEYTSAEVAYKVGIQDASYFSKSFKEQFGMSPKAYQKQAIESLGKDNSRDD